MRNQAKRTKLWVNPFSDPFFAPKAQPLVSPGQIESASDALGIPPHRILSPVWAEPRLLNISVSTSWGDARRGLERSKQS